MNLKSKLWLLLLSSSLASSILLIGIAGIIGRFYSDGYTHPELDALGHQISRELEQVGTDDEQIQARLLAFHNEHPHINLTWFTGNGELRFATDGRRSDFDMKEFMNKFLNMPSNLWEKGKEIALLFDWQQERQQQFLMMTLSSDDMQGSQIFIYIQDSMQLIKLVHSHLSSLL